MPSMNLAHCFVVRIDLPADEVDDEEVMKIHQIIQAQKPAHTTYCLVFRDEATTASRDVYFQVGQGAIGIDEPEQDAEQPESSSEATEAVEAAPARSKAGASKTKTGRARRTAAPKRETKTAGSGRRTRRKKTTKDE